jgi:5-formyltetrahydrofolate cyclo-ligase
VKVNKKDLRKLFIEKRNALTLEECKSRSEQIAELFFSFPGFHLSSHRYLHLYLPIIGKKEIDTTLILKGLTENFPDIKIALSKSDFTNYSMQFFECTKETVLIENVYGIPEPDGGILIKPAQLDLVLVPLLLTDEAGNRIGYGKGFYDRFLAQCRPDCIKIGLSFEKPVPKIIPDEFDVPLDFCITPEKIFDFRKV